MVERDLRVSKDVNIAIYTTSDFPYGGAPENFVRQMALGLNSLDAFVKIILLRGHYTESTINDTGIDCSNLLFKRRFRGQILKFVELVFIIFAIPYSVIRNRIQHKTKVILLYGVEYFYLVFPFFIVGRILGIKVYRVITDRYTDRGIAPTWWKWPKVFFYQLQYRYFDRFLSGVVCLSHYLYQNSIDNGVSEKKICIIPHFINLKNFSVTTNDVPLKHNKVRLGMCGTLTRENGLLVLLDAFLYLKKQNSAIELLLIGPISQEDSSVVTEKLVGIVDSVIFTGKVSGEKVPALLSTCNILINPRISGTFADAGFPTKLGEYFATKRPVVATAVGDLNLYFENKRELILVEPDSAEAIADGILLLIRNKELAKQIGIGGFNWARVNVEYKNSARRLLEFIGNRG